MGLATSICLRSPWGRPPRSCRALTMTTEARPARTSTPPTAAIAYVTVEPESPLPPLTSVGARLSPGAAPEGAELLGELLCGAGGPGNKEVGDSDGCCVEGWLDGADVG